eukprot:GEMP01076217.1.p2 GENE.GEMP01076217.1~~GEMP01076217.1.p2  ORF type:complete len:166 (+),score=27.58 GEMP01076217.1:355-852(+)
MCAVTHMTGTPGLDAQRKKGHYPLSVKRTSPIRQAQAQPPRDIDGRLRVFRMVRQWSQEPGFFWYALTAAPCHVTFPVDFRYHKDLEGLVAHYSKETRDMISEDVYDYVWWHSPELFLAIYHFTWIYEKYFGCGAANDSRSSQPHGDEQRMGLLSTSAAPPHMSQ